MITGELFQVEHAERTAIVVPIRDPDELAFDETQEGELARLFERLDNGQTDNVVVDCQRIDRCCSSAVGFFLKLAKRVRQRNGKMAFCNVSKHLKEVFELLHLGQLWSLYDDRSDALAAVDE